MLKGQTKGKKDGQFRSNHHAVHLKLIQCCMLIIFQLSWIKGKRCKDKILKHVKV